MNMTSLLEIAAMQWVSLEQEVKNLTSIYENQTFDQGLVNVRKLSKTALFVYVFVVFVHYIQTQEKVIHILHNGFSSP